MSEKKKAAPKKIATEKKVKKAGAPKGPRGPVIYAGPDGLALAAEMVMELSQRLHDFIKEGKKCTQRTLDVLDRRISGMDKTVTKIEAAKERGVKSLDGALARLNKSREERGLTPMTMDDFLAA